MKQNDEFSFPHDGKVFHAKATKVEEAKREIKLPRFYPIIDKDGVIYYFCSSDENGMILAFYHAEGDSVIDEFDDVRIPVWESDEILPSNGWFPHSGECIPVSSWLRVDLLYPDGGFEMDVYVSPDSWLWKNTENWSCRITAFRISGGQVLL